jgi:flavin reductase (DIM6/NTAB) family NADH-FMN oxidoreductase RutF
MDEISARVDPGLFRAAMARFPGAVTIITARHGPEHGKERRGITATAVCSVSTDPPSLLACVNRNTGTCAAIAGQGRFNINVLTEDEGDLAMCFAGATGATGEAKFASGVWQADAHGLPVLSGALLSFSCEVTEAVEAGSHSVFIGRITDIRTSADRRALLYERSNFHRLEELGS